MSLAEEVRGRHGELGHAVVGYHVSKDRNAPEATRLMYLTEAIGVYALINNRDLNPAHPVTIVVADEVHERTMYTQMIIGLARTQILVLMSEREPLKLINVSSRYPDFSAKGCDKAGVGIYTWPGSGTSV